MKKTDIKPEDIEQLAARAIESAGYDAATYLALAIEVIADVIERTKQEYIVSQLYKQKVRRAVQAKAVIDQAYAGSDSKPSGNVWRWEKAIRSLPDMQQYYIRCHVLTGTPVQTIADMRNVDAKTVAAAIEQSYKELRKKTQ